MAKVSTSLAAKASASTAVGQKLPKFSAAVKTILESELLKVDCWGRIDEERAREFYRRIAGRLKPIQPHNHNPLRTPEQSVRGRRLKGVASGSGRGRFFVRPL